MSKKIKSTKLVALLLAFVMVLSFVPLTNVKAAVGKLDEIPEGYKLNFEVTANDVKDVVQGRIYLTWRGVLKQQDAATKKTVVEEAVKEVGRKDAPKNIKVVDGKATVDIVLPEEIAGHKISEEKFESVELIYSLAGGKSFKVVYDKKTKLEGLEDYAAPLQAKNAEGNYVYTGKLDYFELQKELKAAHDKLDQPVKDLKFDVKVEYKGFSNDQVVVKVIDQYKQPVENALVEAWSVETDGDTYVLDRKTKDYKPAAQLKVAGIAFDKKIEARSDRRGFAVFDRSKLTTAANGKVVAFKLAESGMDDFTPSDLSKVLNTTEGDALKLVVKPIDKIFTVEVQEEILNEVPYRASEAATVRIIRNVTPYKAHEGHENYVEGEVIAEGKTDKNGLVTFKNVELKNIIRVGEPQVKDDENVLDLNDYIRYNILEIKKEGYEPVYRLVTQKERDRSKANEKLELTDKKVELITRVAGNNRYETAVTIARKTFDTKVPQNIILASGMNFADALVANGITEYYKAPILLTDKEALPESTKGYIEEIGALNKADNKEMKVIVIGGTNVISGKVDEEIQKILKLKKVERIGGKDRFETAKMVYEHITKVKNHDKTYKNDKPHDILLANGFSFADAIIASLPSAQYGHPILLTGPKTLHKTAHDVIAEVAKANKLNTVIAIGGDTVISSNVYGQINHGQKQRLEGNNRYLTSLNVLNTMYADVTKLFVARGDDFADALTASKLAAENNAGILLVNPNGLEEKVVEYLKKSKVTDITIVGGENALGQNIVKELEDILVSR